jgi:pyruvate formate lyase activating enzyme
MTGMIFDIKRYAIHDGPGIRSTVFFKGCPLNCWWCHNPEGLRSRSQKFASGSNGRRSKSAKLKKKVIVGRVLSVKQVMEEIAKDEIFYNQSGGGVTFSGGEPMAQIDFLEASLRECKRLNIHTALDTSGYASPDDFERIRGLVDIILYDIKLMDDDLHQKYTGVSNGIILENLKKLAKRRKNIRIRIPMVPGITDTEKNIEDIAAFLASLKNIDEIDILPYNRLAEDKCARFNLRFKPGRLKDQNDEEISEKMDLFLKRGYKVKIGG